MFSSDKLNLSETVIYKLAFDLNLKGWVNNTSLGVMVDIEGEKEKVISFIESGSHNMKEVRSLHGTEWIC